MSRLFRSVAVLLLMEAVVAALLLAQVLPTYLSDQWETDVTYHVLGEVRQELLPFSKRFDDGNVIKAIECHWRDVASNQVRCRLISTDGVSAGQRFLGTLGIQTEYRYTVAYDRPRLGAYATVIWSLVLTVVVALVWRRLFKAELRADFVACRTAMASQPWLLVLPYAASATIASLALLVWPAQAVTPSKVMPHETWLLTMLATAVIAASLLEELVFRGLVYDLLGKVMGWWPAAFFGSLSFTSLHFLQFGQQAQMLSIFAAGMALCWIRRVSGSVTLCVLAHALLNLIVVLVQFRVGAIQG